MNDKKIIAVTGATGAQGGGLARAILADPDGGFTLRAITRNPDSDKAKALAKRGAEVVTADLDDAATVQAAMEGAHGAFCLTNFWEHFSGEKETTQAKTMADAAKAAGIKHVVWSTFQDTRELVPLDDDRMPTLQGKYKVPHLDAKGEANQYFVDSGVPTTLLLTSFYWDNLIHFGMGPKKGEDGKLTFALPMGEKKLPGIAAADIGKCAYGVFKKGEAAVGTIGIAGEHLTGGEMAAALTKALGQDVGYFAVPFDMYRGFDFPGADDLGNMFQIKHDFNDDYCGARPVDGSRELNPELQSFTDWLDFNGGSIPIE
jgi:uncharacterized protein YbjT (DUF2867 family)